MYTDSVGPDQTAWDNSVRACTVLTLLHSERPKAVSTLLHSERPKLYTTLAFLSAIGLNESIF